MQKHLLARRGEGALKHSHSQGFTLAEVLITLGIIGVVAALTLPILIGNYKKTAYVTGLQKAYSVLNNMTKTAMAKDEVSTFIDTDLGQAWNERYEGADDFENQLRSFFPNAVEFFKNKYYSQLYCPREYSDVSGCQYYGSTGLQSLTYSNNNCVLSSDSILYCFAISSGIDPQDGDREFAGSAAPDSDYGFARQIMVDVNGFKRPNQLGRDIFFFAIGAKSGKVVPDGSIAVYKDYYVNSAYNGCADVSDPRSKKACEAAQEAQAQSKYDSHLTYYNYCFTSEYSSKYDSYNQYCSDKIVNDGWKMNY